MRRKLDDTTKLIRNGKWKMMRNHRRVFILKRTQTQTMFIIHRNKRRPLDLVRKSLSRINPLREITTLITTLNPLSKKTIAEGARAGVGPLHPLPDLIRFIITSAID